jgi:hypothetical protein
VVEVPNPEPVTVITLPPIEPFEGLIDFRVGVAEIVPIVVTLLVFEYPSAESNLMSVTSTLSMLVTVKTA